MSENKQLRSICATIYDPEGLQLFKSLCSQYWVVGNEICPTSKRPHYQCYGQFGRRIRWNAIKKKLKNVHFEEAKGNPESNFKYCTKDGNWEQFGEMEYSGKRNDLVKVKEMIKDGKSMSDIIESEELTLSYQTLKTAELMRKYIAPKRNCKPTVIWVYGHTGTGKTLWSVNEMSEKLNDDYWISSGTLQWWDGYDGQKGVIIDDFRGNHCEFAKLLRYLDRYETRVPVKGAMVPLMASYIIVTSSQSPIDVYSSENVRENIGQLLRRIDQIFCYTQTGDKRDVTDDLKTLIVS